MSTDFNSVQHRRRTGQAMPADRTDCVDAITALWRRQCLRLASGIRTLAARGGRLDPFRGNPVTVYFDPLGLLIGLTPRPWPAIDASYIKLFSGKSNAAASLL